MIDYKKVFIDTAPFIYFIENNTNNSYFNKMKNFFEYCLKNDVKVVTSTITVEEYFVFPYKNNRFDYIDSFERLLDVLNCQVINIDKEIAKTAAKIRAQYTSFKGMDSLQLATAMNTNCDLFITNDKQLSQFSELRCMLLDELEY